MSLQVENSQYTNTHYKKNESDKVIKTNIITQAQNFIRQHIVKERCYTLLIELEGVILIMVISSSFVVDDT
jgi:hypothetical protein